jgi:Aldehyde dehydrogenase family
VSPGSSVHRQEAESALRTPRTRDEPACRLYPRILRVRPDPAPAAARSGGHDGQRLTARPDGTGLVPPWLTLPVRRRGERRQAGGAIGAAPQALPVSLPATYGAGVDVVSIRSTCSPWIRSARVLAGGAAVGPCFPATLLVDVPRHCELATDATFGPGVIVDVIDTAEEAVHMANDSRYGLTAGVLTGNPERGLALAEQLEAGIVHVNDQPIHGEPQMPFGRVKDSGWGRFGISFAVEEFTELRWLTIKSQPRQFPF